MIFDLLSINRRDESSIVFGILVGLVLFVYWYRMPRETELDREIKKKYQERK